MGAPRKALHSFTPSLPANPTATLVQANQSSPVIRDGAGEHAAPAVLSADVLEQYHVREADTAQVPAATLMNVARHDNTYSC